MNQVVNKLIEQRFSFTGIGSAFGIVVLFLLVSFDIVVEPNTLVWVSFSILGGACGLGIDEFQHRYL